MRRFTIHDIHEISTQYRGERFEYEQRVANETNPLLVANFKKVYNWIKENYPNLNGVFPCSHDVHTMLRLAVDNGEATLETGSWSGGFAIAMSADFSEFYSQGSMQTAPYRFEGLNAFPNKQLERFLSEWSIIKQRVIEKGSVQNLVFSEAFSA